MEKLELLKDEKTGNYYLFNGALWYCSAISEHDEDVPTEPFIEVDDQDEIKRYLLIEKLTSI